MMRMARMMAMVVSRYIRDGGWSELKHRGFLPISRVARRTSTGKLLFTRAFDTFVPCVPPVSRASSMVCSE